MPMELAAWLHKMARAGRGFAEQEGRTKQREGPEVRDSRCS